MNLLGWDRNDGKDEGMYWPRTAMNAAFVVYWDAPQYRPFSLVGQEILRQLRGKNGSTT